MKNMIIQQKTPSNNLGTDKESMEATKESILLHFLFDRYYCRPPYR